MSIKLAMELVFAAREKGGGTFDRTGREITPEEFKGYAVGGNGNTAIMGIAGNVIAQVEVIAKWIDENRSQYYGSWVDGDTIYFDPVNLYDDRETAEEMGRLRGEMAIWDFAAGEEIRL